MRRQGSKQSKVAQMDRKRAVAADYSMIIRSPGPDTWSARMPAYAYTTLCPVEGIRMGARLNNRPENERK